MNEMSIEVADRARQIARRRERHWTMLFVATVIVMLSIMLQVRDDTKVELRICPGYPMPEMCLSRKWFQCECPGCGLTRSFILLAQGDWRGSLAMHRVGWLLALAVLAQFPYRSISLRIPGQTASPAWGRWFGWLLIVLLIGNWLFNACCGLRS